MPFSFRQRSGSLNWKLISSLDIDSIVQNCNIADLESIIDVVTFSDFTSRDVKGNTIESISTLVSLMQLIIEYLLHCQESHYEVLHSVHEKNSALKAKCHTLKKENSSLKEDNKIYQRQLSLLRQSLLKSQHLIAVSAGRQPPRIVGQGDEQRPTDANLSPILDSVLVHEKETRDFLKVLLQEQRATFMTEIRRITADEPRHQYTATSIFSNNEDFLKIATEKLCSNVETVLQAAIAAIQRHPVNEIVMTTDSSATPSIEQSAAKHSLPSSLSNSDIISNSIEEAKQMGPAVSSTGLTALYSQLIIKDETITDLRRALAESEKMARTESAKTGAAANEIERLSSKLAGMQKRCDELELITGSTGKLRSRSRRVAIKAIGQHLITAQKRPLARAFRIWLNEMISQRDFEQAAEHSRLLRTAAATYAKREQELAAAVQAERERVLVEQARANVLQRRQEMDQELRERDADRQRQREAVLVALQQEQQRQEEEEHHLRQMRQLVDASMMTSFDGALAAMTLDNLTVARPSSREEAVNTSFEFSPAGRGVVAEVSQMREATDRQLVDVGYTGIDDDSGVIRRGQQLQLLQQNYRVDGEILGRFLAAQQESQQAPGISLNPLAGLRPSQPEPGGITRTPSAMSKSTGSLYETSPTLAAALRAQRQQQISRLPGTVSSVEGFSAVDPKAKSSTVMGTGDSGVRKSVSLADSENVLMELAERRIAERLRSKGPLVQTSSLAAELAARLQASR